MEAYLASADWMEHHMDRRVEVAFPCWTPTVKQELLDFLELQWRDNVKARVLDARLTNAYVARPPGAPAVRVPAASARQDERFIRKKAELMGPGVEDRRIFS